MVCHDFTLMHADEDMPSIFEISTLIFKQLNLI